MKTLVTYSSKTGNTKKIASVISETIDNSILKEIDEVENLDYDLIIVGTWIDKGTADNKALKFIETIKNKKVAFFFTLGAYPHSQHAIDCEKNITELFTKNNNEVIKTFFCQGAIDPQLIEFMKKSFGPDHPHGPNPERIQRWKDASTHPDNQDLENAKETFKNLI